MSRCAKFLCYLQADYCISCKSHHKVWLMNLYSFKLIGNFAKRVNVVWLRDWLPSLSSSTPRCAWTSHHSYQTSAAVATWHNLCRVKGNADIRQTASIRLTLILRRSRTGTVWFYTSTSNKKAARSKLYTKSLTRDLKRMYSRLTLVRISFSL